MTTQTIGTVINGTLQLDHPLELPNQSRVQVTVRSLAEGQSAGVEAFLTYADAHPVDSGGLRYTRDELHERR